MRAALVGCSALLGLQGFAQPVLQPLAYGPSAYVSALLVDTAADVLFLGGGFLWVNDTILSPGVVRWTGEAFEPLGCGIGLSWCDTTITNQTQVSPVVTLALWNGDLYAGGDFFYTANGESFNFVARWDGTEWHPAGVGMDGPVRSLKAYPDALYAAGWFNTADGDSCRGLAKWDGATWSPVVPLPDIDNGAGSAALNDVEVIGDSIYVGGNFSGPGNMQSFIWYDGTQWNGVQDGLAGNGADVDVIRSFDGELLVGGSFAGPPFGPIGNPSSGLVKTDGLSWTTYGDGTLGSYNKQVNDVVKWDGDLIACGAFDRMGGVPTDCLSSWDGARWCSLLPAGYLDNTLACVAVFHDTLYIGGGFHTAGGDTIRFVAKYIGTLPDTCGFAVSLPEQPTTSNQLLLWPNPAQDQLRLGNTTAAYATITDAMGRQVAAQPVEPQATLLVHALASGCYLVQLRNTQHQLLGTARFLKE